MKAMPRIEKFMTPMPHTIGRDIPIKTAMSMMREHGVRHLPVQEGGELVGVLTDRDVKFGASFAGSADLCVEEVMTADPYVVEPGTPLDVVISEMVQHKYGCAVVAQDNGKIVGIFTAIDGLRTMLEQLRANYRAVG
jgi:acetoin utilization protein AcuB